MACNLFLYFMAIVAISSNKDQRTKLAILHDEEGGIKLSIPVKLLGEHSHLYTRLYSFLMRGVVALCISIYVSLR